MAGRSTNCDHQGDSFEEQVYQATGLNVADVITGNATITNAMPDQPETALHNPLKNPSILNSSDTNNQASLPETSVEGIVDGTTVELEMDSNKSTPIVNDDAMQNKPIGEDIVNSSPANVDTIEEIHEEEDSISNNTLKVKDTTANTVQENTTTNENRIAQKGDRKVRFNLENTEEREDSTAPQNILQSLTINSELSKDENGDNDLVSSNEVSTFTMSAEQVKLLGYTQLRELKCSLETKLGCELRKYCIS